MSLQNWRQSCYLVQATSVKKMGAAGGQLAVAVPDADFCGQASEDRLTTEAPGSI